MNLRTIWDWMTTGWKSSGMGDFFNRMNVVFWWGAARNKLPQAVAMPLAPSLLGPGKDPDLRCLGAHPCDRYGFYTPLQESALFNPYLISGNGIDEIPFFLKFVFICDMKTKGAVSCVRPDCSVSQRADPPDPRGANATRIGPSGPRLKSRARKEHTSCRWQLVGCLKAHAQLRILFS
jgi:hypothetical protein